MTAPIRGIRVAGPWDRLHRAESDALKSLLSAEERAAVDRRLGLPRAPAVGWVPAGSGGAGGRFAEPNSPGALYLGQDPATCLAEVCHHFAALCRASVGTPIGTRAVFRHLVFQVSGTMADAAGARRPGLHDPEDYGPSWAYGRFARAAGLDGVHYRSVRCHGGRCLAVFEKRALTFSRIALGAVVIVWDGHAASRFA